MKIGEVCLNTNDVVKLANFYKQLLGIDFSGIAASLPAIGKLRIPSFTVLLTQLYGLI